MNSCSMQSTAAARFYQTFFKLNAQGCLRQDCGARLNSQHRSFCMRWQRKAYSAGAFNPTKSQRDSQAAVNTLQNNSQPTPRRDINTTNINIQADLSTHTKHLMRRIPHPVIVITASQPSAGSSNSSTPPTPESAFRGMTVSSFNTVALEPAPIVSFNVRAPSSTHSALTQTGTFLAHVLSSSSTGARIADAFAKGGNTQGEAFQMLAQGRSGPPVRIFAGESTHGAPLLADGVLKVLRCRILPGKEIEVGDHRVLVAEVLGLMSAPERGIRGGESLSENCLLYGNQGYRQLGSAIDPDSSPGGAATEKTIGLNVRQGDEHQER